MTCPILPKRPWETMLARGTNLAGGVPFLPYLEIFLSQFVVQVIDLDLGAARITAQVGGWLAGAWLGRNGG